MTKAATAPVKFYANERTAKGLATLAEKRKGVPYQVVKLPQGFQVCPVTVVSKPDPKKALKTKAPDATKVVQVTLPYAGESKSYINVMHEGVVRYVGKATAVSYKVYEENKTVTMVLPLTFAKKRGFEWSLVEN